MKTKAQRRQRVQSRIRRAGREARQQENFTKPLTPKRAGKIARAQSGTEYKPVIRQLRGEAKASAKREGQIGSWYTGLGDLIDQMRTGASQDDAALQNTLTTRLAAAGAQDASQLKDLAAADDSFAKLVGGPTNAPGMAAAAAGNTALAQQRVTMAQPIAAAGTSFKRYLGQRRVSAGERGIEARQAERGRRSKILSDLQAARKERGQATVKNLQTLREGDRDYGIQKVVAGGKKGYNEALEQQSRLGLKGTLATAGATVAAANASAGARRRTASATEHAAETSAGAKRRSAKAQERVADKQGRNSTKSKGGYSVREAVGLLREGFKTGQKVSYSEAVDYLVNRGVDAAVAKAAVKRQAGG